MTLRSVSVRTSGIASYWLSREPLISSIRILGMSLPDLSGVVGLGSRICPARGFARSLERTFASLLSSGGLYLSSGSYSRFALSMLFYPAPVEIVLLACYGVGGLFFVGPLVLVQVAPFLFPVVRAQTRRRSIEAELPFFLMTLSVFVHEAKIQFGSGW